MSSGTDPREHPLEPRPFLSTPWLTSWAGRSGRRYAFTCWPMNWISEAAREPCVVVVVTRDSHGTARVVRAGWTPGTSTSRMADKVLEIWARRSVEQGAHELHLAEVLTAEQANELTADMQPSVLQ